MTTVHTAITTAGPISSYVGNHRITDYSFCLAKSIDAMDTVPATDALALYDFLKRDCVGTTALYPQSNWQTHRLVVMSILAVRLSDRARVDECHELAMQWLPKSNCRCCDARSLDFHERDSCQYIIYGWWGLAQAMVYLQRVNHVAYLPYFDTYFRWLAPYQNGEKTHIEFVHSRLPEDVNKPMYDKPFDPVYHQKTLQRVLDQLKA